ncbi:MAG: capsular biosynthesis protein CpsI [Firmicutes bacterium HGW-Firmicutes-7]|nr:MAG: capsular biosynthesis protein CpsI [Firmicutes bacterium HGW-Firmicutes-7]
MVLVTGCAGFIGFHLCQRLIKEGHQIVGIDNLNKYYDVELKKARLEILKDSTSFIFKKLDITNKKLLDRLFRKNKINRVYHLAAQAGVRYSLVNPSAYIEANIQGFLNILEACKDNEIQHLIYASSSSVYGSNTEIPFSVMHKVDHPVSMYAATKKTNELMAYTYSYLYRLPTTGLRFFTVYGPWGRPDMALFLFVDAIINDQPIKVFNYGKIKRDFTYIDDIIESLVRLLDKPSQEIFPYNVYNIGNGQPVELEKFIEVIEKEIGKKSKKDYRPLQNGDVPITYADCKELFDAIQFSPETTIEYGVKKFLDWYKNYYGIS